MNRDAAGNAAPSLTVDVMAPSLSIVRLPPGSGVPDWIERDSWHSVTRTADECSVVCESRLVPAGVSHVGPWRGLKVAGPLAFDLVGVLYRLAGPLADTGISVFVISTYDTDYVLVRGEALDSAIAGLEEAGVVVRCSD